MFQVHRQVAGAFDPSLVAYPGTYLTKCEVHNDRLPDNARHAGLCSLPLE